jgi:hypothetical protein
MQAVGTSGQIQTFNRETRPAFNTTLTWIHGSHTYKAGAEAQFQGNLFATYAGVTLAASSTIPSNFGATAEPFTPGASLAGFQMGFPYANFLLGDYVSTNQTPQIDYRAGKTQWNFFVQDTWKVTRKLTIDYGLRYDYSTPTRETYNRLGKFDPTIPNANAGGRPGATTYGNTCNCDFYPHAYPYAIGPRIGFAYQLNSKTVIRGGWGVVYQYTADGVSGATVSTNATNTATTGINSFVNTQSSKFIQPAVWPVTNPSVFPNIGTTTGAPSAPDANFFRPPRQNQWSIGLQRSITPNLLVEASYVANRQVWIPGPYGFLNQISPGTYNKYGIYPYAGSGPAGYNYSPAGNVLNAASGAWSLCLPGNDCDRYLLGQPINSAAVMAKMAAAGVGNGGLFLPYPSATPASTTLSTALRAFPQFPGLAVTGSATGDERYDSLQAKLTKRFSHGLQASGAFTWEKSFTRAAPQDFFNPSGSLWALQNLPPRILTFNITYTTPKLAYLTTHAKYANLLVQDWQIGWFSNYQSGTLLTPPNSQTSNFLSSQMVRVQGQPLYLKDMNSHNINPYYDQVLNPAAWQNLPVNAVGASTAVLYTDFRGPRHPQENANIARNFRIKEKLTLQFRGEFVNIFNRTLLPNPITSVNPTVALTRNAQGILTNGFGVMNAYFTPNSQGGTTTSAQNGGAAFAGRSGTLVLRVIF